jgi:hypothetical protein
MVVDNALIKEAYCQRVNIETDQKIKGHYFACRILLFIFSKLHHQKSLPCVIGVVDTSR